MIVLVSLYEEEERKISCSFYKYTPKKGHVRI